MLLLALSSASTTSAVEPPWITETLAALDTHLARHPAAEADDVYKLLHQAVMGPGHAIGDPVSAHRWLDREIATLERSDHDEPLCEAIGGDPAMVRIHLRPFVARGLDPDELSEAFIATAAGMPPSSPERLGLVVRAAVEHLRSTGKAARAEALGRLRARLSARGFPAIHHSQTFRDAYAPSYRVVRRGLAEAAGWCDDPAASADVGTSEAGVGADVDAGHQGGS